jgi:hypothetical protein
MVLTPRRKFLGLGAAAMAAASVTSQGGILQRGATTVPIFVGPGVYRGVGQAMRSIPYSLGIPVSIWSCLTRIRSYANCRFRRFKVCLPLFANAGASFVDTSFATNYNLQVGFEYPYVSATSGIPVRIPVTFSGNSTYAYNASSGPYGWAVSDIIDIGAIIPAGNFFGAWFLIESAAQTTAPIPATSQISNYTQRYTGYSQIGSSQLGNTFNSSGITACSGLQQGVQGYVGFLLVEDLDGIAHVIGIGDSTMWGVGIGYVQNTSTEDWCGDSLANASWYERFAFEKLGINFVNFGRSSDSFKFMAASLACQYRMQGVGLCNPTHVWCAHGINDLFDSGGISATLGYAQTVYGLIQAQTSAPIIAGTVIPNSSSTDEWETIANQAATTAVSTRNSWNDTYVRTYPSALGNAGFIDANPVFENGYTEGNPSSESCLYIVNDTAYWPCVEGVHPSSNIAPLVVSGGANPVYCSRAGVSVSNPFT